jgi:hypothetical protein
MFHCLSNFLTDECNTVEIWNETKPKPVPDDRGEQSCTDFLTGVSSVVKPS